MELIGCMRRAKSLVRLVEQRGIEPLTSALRTRRSAKLSYCPTKSEEYSFRFRLSRRESENPQITQNRRQKAAVRLRIADCGLRISNCELNSQRARAVSSEQQAGSSRQTAGGRKQDAG